MYLSGRMVFVGVEKKTSQKGKEYIVVALAQGADVMNAFMSDDEVLKYPLYKEYNVMFRYNASEGRLSIESMKTAV